MTDISPKLQQAIKKIRDRTTKNQLNSLLGNTYLRAIFQYRVGKGLKLLDDDGRIDLRYHDLTDADLSEADLSRVNLSRAILINANLSEANLSEANLSGADLTDANLLSVDLTDTILDYARIVRTRFLDVKNPTLAPQALALKLEESQGLIHTSDLSNVPESLLYQLSEYAKTVQDTIQAEIDRRAAVLAQSQEGPTL